MPEKTGLLRRSESSGTTYYELASEFLISWIQKQQKKFKKLFLVVWAWAFAGLVSLLFLIGWFAHKAKDATKQVTQEPR